MFSFLCAWFFFFILGLHLLSLRKDNANLQSWMTVARMHRRVGAVVIIIFFIVIPLTIPFSINEILKNK